MTECYRCGQEGHRAAQCDWQPPSRYPPPVEHQPAHEVADAHAWAEKIRHRLGWTEKADD